MKLQELFEAKIASDSAMNTMVNYIERKLGIKLIRVPGIESFNNSSGGGHGLRYIYSGSTKSLRFNWASLGSVGKAASLQSIDFWSGTSHDPSFSIEAQGVSLVKVLPSLVKIIAAPKLGKVTTFPVAKLEDEAALTEARKGEFTAERALDDFLKKLQAGKTFTRSDFGAAYHSENVGIFDTILKDFGDKFEVKGKRISMASSGDASALRNEIMKNAGAIVVSAGGSGETYAATQAEAAIEEKVPFADTLKHLAGLTRSLVKGAFNALFVAGKGGTGKTQTIEDTLASMGLADGSGYFKNTGSASAVGVYSLLYQHRKDIIVFDDSDGALADQDARNIIKAATDTKKKRKLVWNKKSSFIFDPESEDAEAYEDDPVMVPKYFDFEGRIIFISNLPLNKLDPDGALRTRAFVINVDPTDEELFERMREILHDIKLEGGLKLSSDERENVMKVVVSSKRKGDVSLRKLVRALNLAASGAENWQELVRLYA